MHEATIPPSDLILDANNPRLGTPNSGQRDTLRAMAKLQGDKLVALASDIAINHLDPSTLPICLEPQKDQTKYVVLEGNRRLVALRALENPDALVGAIDDGTLKGLRRAAEVYRKNPIDGVRCLVVKDRQQADHWIKLRHTGENSGAGTVRWGSDEVQRFMARGGRFPLHVQVVNWMQDRKSITPEDRADISMTNLRRLLGTPEVRQKVGIDLSSGQLRVIGDENRVDKALRHLIGDLGNITVKDIYTKEQRRQYAEKFPKSLIAGASPTTNSPRQPAGRAKPSAPPAPPPRPRERPTLIPHDCVLQVSNIRCQRVANELRRLSVDDYPNAVAVLFRVFLELSVDEYIVTNKVLSVNEHSKLNVKISAVLDSLLARKKLNDQQATPVRSLNQKKSFLVPSVDLLHAYVHNQHMFPSAGDLRTGWDNLQSYFSAIWS